MLSITQKVILGFVTLLIGVILIVEVASTVSTKTDTTAVTDEAITMIRFGDKGVNTTPIQYYLTNRPTGWKITDCPLTNVVVGNASTAFTLTTDYLIDTSTGNLSLKNTLVVNQTSTTGANANKTYVDYSYCGDEYMNLSWGRTLLDIVPGFFGIALLLVAVALFYSVAKDTGIV